MPKTVSQDRIRERAAEQITDTPVPQVVEEFAKVFNVFSQSRVQQQMMEQITETPAVSLAEETVETPKTQTQEKIICCLKEDQSEFSEERQGHASHKRIQECTVEETDVPVPHMMEKTIEVVRFIPQERVQNRTVEQVIDEPDPQIQEAEEHRDEDEVNKTKVEAKNGLENHCATTRSTSIVEQMKSKFEVGHKKRTQEAGYARNRSDQNR